MRRDLALAIAVLGLLATLPAYAATHAIDDSASQVLGSNLRMKWDSPAPQRGQRPTVSGTVTVLARLNVAVWKGHVGRIYMKLPAQASGPVTASWSTRGPLLPGILRAGERTLVYAGPITSDLIEDTLRLVIQTDGDRLVRTEQLNFSFEIDVE
jgi:hypothetical protein